MSSMHVQFGAAIVCHTPCWFLHGEIHLYKIMEKLSKTVFWSRAVIGIVSFVFNFFKIFLFSKSEGLSIVTSFILWKHMGT